MQLLICNPIPTDDEIDVQVEEKELAILSELYKTSCVSGCRGRILQEYFSMTKTLTTIVLAVLLGGGTFALTAGSALADVVCNNEGDCWHVKDHYTYPSGVTIQVHPDD